MPFLCLLFSIFSAAEAKTLNVAVALRFEDKYNSTVGMFRDGIKTAKTLYEKTNPGVRVNLEEFSHTLEIESLLEVTSRILKKKIPAVLGAETSDEALVFGDRFGKEKVVLLSPSASNPRVTLNKPYVFTACLSDKEIADKLAKFVVGTLKPKAVGVFQNLSYSYSEYLSKEFAAAVERYRSKNVPINVVTRTTIRGTQDFSKIIDAFKEAGVTHVAAFTYDSDFIPFVAHAHRKGFFPFFVGSDGWGSDEFVLERFVKRDPGGKFLAYRNSYWKEDIQTPLGKEFHDQFKKAFHRPPNAWNALGFDAAWILFTGMDRAANPASGESIRKSLKALRGIRLVTTRQLQFNATNVPEKDLFLYKISKEGVQYEATLP